MPTFKIGGSYDTDWEDEVEAADVEEAREIARDAALERVDYWAEPIEESTEEEDPT